MNFTVSQYTTSKIFLKLNVQIKRQTRYIEKKTEHRYEKLLRIKKGTNIKSLRGHNDGQFSVLHGAPGTDPQRPGPPASSPLPGPSTSFPHQSHSSHKAACPCSHSPFQFFGLPPCPGYTAGERQHYHLKKKKCRNMFIKIND